MGVACYRPAKVTEFEDGRLRVHEEVLGLDVSVTHTLGMDISQTAEQLVHVYLREGGRGTRTREPVSV